MIEVENLSKHFHIRKHHKGAFAGWKNFFTRESTLLRAVDGISFSIQRGETVGYLGPNGAGKSTTIKMLSGLLFPTSGKVSVGGLVPWQNRKAYVSRIGVVFGQRTTLWWDLPVIESLELFQHIYKVPAERFRSNLKEFEDLLGLKEFMHTPVRSLSLGQRMRADLCAALLHDPEILFLDEPTIGLDILAKERIREFILHVNQQRETTVLLTTHDLSDVQTLCQRVMIIDHGHLLYDGDIPTLQKRFGGERELIVDFAETYPDVSIPGAKVGKWDHTRVTYTFKDIAASELIRRISERYSIVDLTVKEPDIEGTIRNIYQHDLLSAPV
ncbi:ABC transporter ATP-binding protein [Deinococcus cellulosilyticus]|uniref:ABC transporter ATP-binding protein n=1 Tax=Deinococcus cellulosilyticus (strain DSM 18568 / NBRC 106333 / KACC 11606 / 5516J-15) TaxID=1223518 RepID=A0A511N862_DEIC1|nr:ATP-binding cassette domain-containing protein [Deinococcus cellulosilyticus]GEM49014.1 ABC transporter ATP-binding protein [Deinococcus cellulosilyticus NBRC 106333 = KACC 11606]